MNAESRAQRILLIILIAAGCGLRIFVCLQHNPLDYLKFDMLRHWENGGSLRHAGFWGASDPIGYQVYISVLRHVTHGNRNQVALACGLLSVLMPWTYYRAARNLGLRRVPALWVWALITWTPSLFVIYGYVMMETLLLVLQGAALWATARYLRKGSPESFLVSIIAWTLASLTKPTVIPLAVGCAGWSYWKKRTSWKTLAVAAVLAVGLLVPQAIRSNAVLGFAAPFGNPWLTRIQHRSGAIVSYFYFRRYPYRDGEYHVGSPTCWERPFWPLSSWQIEATCEASVSFTVDAANGKRDWETVYASFHTSTQQWLARWKENVIVFLFAPSWPENSSVQWDSQLEFRTRWVWAPLILLVVVSNVRRFIKGNFELLPVAVTIFILVLALQNVINNEGRYRKPLEPLLILNAVWLVAEHYRRRQADDPLDSRASLRIAAGNSYPGSSGAGPCSST